MARNFRVMFFMVLCLTGASGFAQAPTVSYAGPQTYTVGAAITTLTPTSSGVAAPAYGSPIVTGSGLSLPYGIAIDGSGNIIVADAGNNAVKKIPAGGGTPVSLGSGFNNPTGVAFRAGYIYIADYGNNTVEKMPAAGGTPVVIGTGFSSPSAVAVDAFGNVFVGDAGHKQVKEILASNGSTITVALNFNTIAGIAVDGLGNVYVADSGNNLVRKLPAGGGQATNVGSGFNSPIGVSVDASENIYVADKGNGLVKKVRAAGGVPVSVGSTFAAGFSPYGIVCDGLGDIYVMDRGNAVANEIEPTGGYYIHPVLPAGLILNNTTGAITGTPTALKAATTYTIKAYNSTGNVSATLSIAVNRFPAPHVTYASPQSYAVNVAISPLTPANSGGAVPAQSTTTVGATFNNPVGVAVDATGNYYIADSGNNLVKEMPAGTGTTVTLGSGFSDPTGVAADASGNVYVADNGNNAVKEILYGGTMVTLGSGFSHPYGIALDAAGNIYVSDAGNNQVKKMPAGGGTPTVIGTGFNAPAGLAVDAAGNVFVADQGNNAIKEIVFSSGSTITIAAGAGGPSGVALDAAGQIYITDQTTPTLTMIPKGGGTAIALGSGLVTPAGVATDQYGFAYVTDTFYLRKISVGGYFISPALPAGLSFNASTGVISGTPTATSTATTYSIVAFNSSGRDTTTLNITITTYPVPVISYASPQVYTAGVAISSLTPTNTGGAVGTQTSTTVGTGFEGPVGLAIDATGNIFVSQDNPGYGIDKIPVGGGSAVRVGGSNYGDGIAVDGSGNLYLGMASNLSQVLKIPAGSPTGTAIGSGFSLPRGVAVDPAGNVYVADHNLNVIKKIPAGGGAPVSLGSGFINPTAVAVDAAGNVYVADNGNNLLKEIPAGGGSPIALGRGHGNITGVAVDAGGYVYFTDGDGVTKVPPGGGFGTLLPYSFYNPIGIAVDGANNLFVANSNSSSATVVKVSAGGYTVSPALPAGLTLNTSTGAITGTPITASPATNYTVTAFNNGGYGTFAINIKVNAAAAPVISYTTPHVYMVGTAISPLSPTNTGGPVGTINPVAVLSQGGNAFAMDAAGNYYVSQTMGTTVTIYQTLVKIPANGGPAVELARLSTTNELIKGITVDASGNVYFTTFKAGNIWEIPVGGGPNINLANINAPYGIAIDPAGNIYVASTTDNSVYKIPPGGGTPVSVGTGFTDPTSMATDASGNLFIIDKGHNALKEIPAGGSTPLKLAGGVGNGVTADGAGNVYFLNSATSISRFSAIGGLSVYASGFYNLGGLAANSNGDVFAFDYGQSVIDEIAPGGYFVNPALPAGLNLDINTGVISGTPTAVHVSTFYTVSAYNTGGYGSATVGITVNGISNVATLAHMAISRGVLTPAFAAATTSYTAAVSNAITSITITPTTTESHATVTVNGTAVTSGTASAALPLVVGPNTITTVVTAQDGTTTKTYTLTVTRAASANANMARLAISKGILTPTFTAATTSYTVSEISTVTSVTLKPTTSDATATVKVNGVAVTSGTVSGAIPLAAGPNTLTVVVTAQDGTTTKTYTITVTRAASTVSTLAHMAISRGVLAPAFNSATTSYTTNVGNPITSITLTPTTSNAGATVTVNGTPVTSGTASGAIALATGPNTITTVVTAEDGTTTTTYTLTVTRAGGSMNSVYEPISVAKPIDEPQLNEDGVLVHPGLSPNGDGINDFLLIDGIANYPDNKLQVMNRSGQLVFEAKSYDNSSKVFDGHSNKTGAMQLPGTYFYSLDYMVNGITKHKTGFIVLKY